MGNKILSAEYTQKRVEKLQKAGKITDVQKEDIFSIMTADDKTLQNYNKSNEEQPNSSYVREVYDEKINAGLQKYEINQTPIMSQKEKVENYGGVKELIKYTFNYNKIWKDTYLEQRKTWTPEQKAVVEKIEAESGGKVKCVVDPKFINIFSKVMGVHYAGSALLGERIAVSSPEYLEKGLLRHEAIHCLQQSDMGGAGKKGFLKWLTISLPDLVKKQFFSEVKGLAESADYATDNQITDLETYMNQYTDGYLKNRQKDIHKKYKDPAFLRQEYARIRDGEYQELLTKKETVKQLIEVETNAKHKLELEIEFKELEAQVKQMEKVIQRLDGEDETRVVMIRPDKPNTEKTTEKFGDMTETAKNRKIRLPMERFIQKHGKKADGYREGVYLWLKLQSLIKDISATNKLTPEAFQELEKEAIYLVNRYGEMDGIEMIKRKYPIE